MLMMAKMGVLTNTTLEDQPFSYGGSWEASVEGWVGGARTSGNARSGSWKMQTVNATESLVYTIDNVIGDMQVYAIVYHRCASSTTISRAIYGKIGSGSYTLLNSTSDNSTSYAQLVGGIVTSSGQSLSIMFQSNGFVYWDDWSIQTF
jgi:hypothetical protein